MSTFKKGSVVKFKYHMLISDEDTTAALTVYTYSEMHVYERRLLEIRGNRGISWHSETVCLPEGTYQLAFVTTHGLQFLSDIALNDVELSVYDTNLSTYKQLCDAVYSVENREGKYLTNTT